MIELLGVAGGAFGGWLSTVSLRWQVGLLVRRRLHPGSVLALSVGRLSILCALVLLAVIGGGPAPLAAALLGFLAARTFALVRARRGTLERGW